MPYYTRSLLTNLYQENAKYFALSLLVATMTLSVMGCDTNQPADSTNDVKVDIEQTKPLTAGQSVGEAQIEIVSNDNDILPAETIEPSEAVPEPNSDHQIAQEESKDNPNCIDLGSTDAPSIVVVETDNVKMDSPEATIVRAINTLYYSCAEDAVVYYHTQIPDFANQLAQTQLAFQKTVKRVTLKEVKYNETQDMATVIGEIKLAGVDEPDYAEFGLQKVNGHWKILG